MVDGGLVHELLHEGVEAAQHHFPGRDEVSLMPGLRVQRFTDLLRPSSAPSYCPLALSSAMRVFETSRSLGVGGATEIGGVTPR